MNKIAIVGGGAAGLAAAITAARNSADVTIYERTDRIGKKILATGNGRCNLTNQYADVTHYHGSNPKFVIGAFAKFTVEDTLHFFRELGVISKTEDSGKVYPYSDQASSILDVLRFEIARLGVKTVTNFEVSHITKTKKQFKLISYTGETAEADIVIMATGGKAAQHLGSNGSGYDILKKLGHTVTDVFPALVQIKTDTQFIKALKGIKIDAIVKVITGNKTLRTEQGEILFTEYGLSGPPIFQLSRIVGQHKNAVIVLDSMPDYTKEELITLLSQRKSKTKTLETYFIGMLNKRLGQTLLKVCGIAPLSRASDTLSDAEISLLADIIKGWHIKTAGTMSWNNAQVTAGGICTKEVSPSTMESKLIQGLYITGELLDIDGDCGGFNLQWAWSSGVVAGAAASETIIK